MSMISRSDSTLVAPAVLPADCADFIRSLRMVAAVYGALRLKQFDHVDILVTPEEYEAMRAGEPSLREYVSRDGVFKQLSLQCETIELRWTLFLKEPF